jgi:hypothetical protein
MDHLADRHYPQLLKEQFAESALMQIKVDLAHVAV